MEKMLMKTELTKLLVSIFGDNIKKIIEEHYDANKPDELLALTDHMLSGYMGRENARALISEVMKKFPGHKWEN